SGQGVELQTDELAVRMAEVLHAGRRLLAHVATLGETDRVLQEKLKRKRIVVGVDAEHGDPCLDPQDLERRLVEEGQAQLRLEFLAFPPRRQEKDSSGKSRKR